MALSLTKLLDLIIKVNWDLGVEQIRQLLYLRSKVELSVNDRKALPLEWPPECPTCQPICFVKESILLSGQR